MKSHLIKMLLGICCFWAGAAFALDNQGWLAKARKCAESHSSIETDETKEDGVYCLVLAAIGTSTDKTTEQQIGIATLEAKARLTAFVHGEKVSAEKKLEQTSVTVSENETKRRNSYKKFQKRIETRVEALVKGMKMVGQITVGENSFVVCVTCERYEDNSKKLEAAVAEYGDEGVVLSVGEARTVALAKQRALRGAVEQVMGTVVVGYDKMSSTKGFSSKVFSGTDGCVEKYRVLSTVDIDGGVRVEIVAKVSRKELLKDYTNYMKFIGNPGFYIESNTPNLASHFTEFFTDMGIRIVQNPDSAKYAIFCTGTFRPLAHPIDEGRNGYQLSLRFRVQEINGHETLVDMKNDPRKSACFVGSSPDQQKVLCAEKAFRQMKNPLHERIQKMIGRLVGRKMEQAVEDDD